MDGTPKKAGHGRLPAEAQSAAQGGDYRSEHVSSACPRHERYIEQQFGRPPAAGPPYPDKEGRR